MRSSALAATEPKRAAERTALRRILVCMTDSLLWLFSLSTYGALENPASLEIQAKWTGPRGSTGRHRRTRKLPPRRPPRDDPGTASFTRHGRGHGLPAPRHTRGHGLTVRRRSRSLPAGLLAQPLEDDVEHR